MKPAATSTLILLALACLYICYGLTHPPRPRAFRYQGVNTIRDITLEFNVTNSAN
jgi:hypothetical protein